MKSWKQGGDIMQACQMFVGGNNETLITLCIELNTGSHINHFMYLYCFFSLSLVDFSGGGGRGAGGSKASWVIPHACQFNQSQPCCEETEYMQPLMKREIFHKNSCWRWTSLMGGGRLGAALNLDLSGAWTIEFLVVNIPLPDWKKRLSSWLETGNTMW